MRNGDHLEDRIVSQLKYHILYWYENFKITDTDFLFASVQTSNFTDVSVTMNKNVLILRVEK